MKTLITCFTFTLLAHAGVSIAEQAKDETYDNGSSLHQDHCNKCHGDEMYTRDNRFVNSIDALGKQVRRCKDNLGMAWFDEDTDAVVHFLNKKYYKF